MMFKYACMILFSIILSHSSPVLPADELSGIVEGVRKRYSKLPGFAVPYTREILSKSMAMLGDPIKTDLATGRIYFKPSQFLRVEQETPRPETIITDGHILWWYIPQKLEAYKYPARKLGEELRLLVGIFGGLRKVEEAFDVILTGRSKEEDAQLKLTPNPPWPQIDHLNLWVGLKEHTIRVVEIYNQVGGITRFILGEIAVQKSFEEGFFSFVVPEGVKVTEEEG